MDKKGIVALSALVKLAPHLIVTLVLVAVGATIYGQFFAEEQSAFSKDLDRLEAQIESLTPGDSVPVFTLSNGTSVMLYAKGSDRSPARCAKLACLCPHVGESSDECRRFEELKSCSDVSCRPDDARCLKTNACIVESTSPVPLATESNERKNIFVCKSQTGRISIAESSTSCQGLVSA